MAPQDTFIDDEEEFWYVLFPDARRSPGAQIAAPRPAPALDQTNASYPALSASRSSTSLIGIFDHALAVIRYAAPPGGTVHLVRIH